MDYFLHIASLAAIFGILALSLDLLVGYTGIPAFGHGAFCLIGAYSSALTGAVLGWPPVSGFLIGFALSAGLGAAAAFPAARLRGDYLALATLGLAVIVHHLSNNLTGLTRGAMGVPGIPTLLPIGSSSLARAAFTAVAIFCLAATYGLLRRVARSPFGTLLRCVRDDETAAACLGIDVRLRKLQAFVLSAVMASAAGSLYAHLNSYIAPSMFDIDLSVGLLLMVVLGGSGTLSGPVLGAFILILLPELLRLAGTSTATAAIVREFIFGAGLVLLMIFRPTGILKRTENR